MQKLLPNPSCCKGKCIGQDPIFDRTHTMTAGPPVVKPYRKSDGIPVMTEIMEKDTLDKVSHNVSVACHSYPKFFIRTSLTCL